MPLDHYVSQVHLRRFYSPALNGLMHALRKSDLKSFTPTAKAVCRIDEGSTNKYLSEPRAIEEFLKPVEAKYNAAVSALQAGKPDHDSIYVVAGFTGYVMGCSPAGMRINIAPLEGAVEATAKLLERDGTLPPPPTELGSKSLSGLLDSGVLKLSVDPKYPQAVGVATILQLVATFGNVHWDIIINEHRDCPFFTSDYPVAVERTSDPRIVNRIVPLAPNIAVRIRPNLGIPNDLANLDFRGFSFEQRTATRQEAIQINRLIVRSAEDVVFFRDDWPWVGPFVEKNRNFRIETENTQIELSDGILQIYRQAIMPFQRQ